MPCTVCGGAKTKIGMLNSDIVCGFCGMSLHIDGHFFGYFKNDVNF